MTVTKRSIASDLSLILGLIALGFSAWGINQVIELRQDVSKLQDPAEVDTLVEASLARIQQRKFQAQAHKNLSDWQASSDVPSADRTKLYGSPSARFTIIEYSDLECPYCRNFHATPKYLVDNSKGNVNWQWKHLPLSFHEPAATNGALASECVYDQKGSQGFWAFTDQWFKQSQGNGKGPAQPVAEIAASVGVETGAFETCMLSAKHAGSITEQKEYGARIGITGTPATMIVDNLKGERIYVKGGVPIANMAKAINELAQKPKADMEQQTMSDFEKDRLAVRIVLKPTPAPMN